MKVPGMTLDFGEKLLPNSNSLQWGFAPVGYVTVVWLLELHRASSWFSLWFSLIPQTFTAPDSVLGLERGGMGGEIRET